MSATPRVTVAMSMHNASRFLRECIDSILAQSMPDFELLIADDGSTDSSLDVALSYADPRIRLIRCPHDFIASLNTLLGEARGRYIARMDADDVMLPDRLRLEADWLDSHPDIDAVCARAISIDEQGRTLSSPGAGAEREITPRIMAEGNAVCNPTAMVRRATLERLGLGYEQAFCWAEDYRFWAELLRRGGRMVELPQPLIRYRHSPGQVTATRWDEMMEASSRIRAGLIGRLVEQANPGYTDPRIPATGHELTLIIPFLNEGPEVARTVRSFMAHAAGRADVIVINDASYDSYPYMRELTAIPGVTYVLNRTRLGVAASRDKGVALCRTPYFLLLDAHMRAYDDSWLTAIPTLLRENDRRILCCQTRCLMRASDGSICDNPKAEPTFGARLLFSLKYNMPGIEWGHEEHEPGNDVETIEAILGAGYALSKRYWDVLGGLFGLREYGCDEQFLTLKTQLEGGECTLLKRSTLGHIYRDYQPYGVQSVSAFVNHLTVTETLFPLKAKCLCRAALYIADRRRFAEAFPKIRAFFSENKDYIKKLNGFSALPFDEITRRNRFVKKVERELAADIAARTDEIACFLSAHSPANPGVIDGKAACAVWLCRYSLAHGKERHAATAAARLIREAITETAGNDFSFRTGLPGLGWAISLLMQDDADFVCGSQLQEITDAVRRHVAGMDISLTGPSFADGLAGILAFACTQPDFISDRPVARMLDRAAQKILSDESISIKEAFYAFLWMQTSNDRKPVSDISIADWSTPGMIIPKESRFWNVSFDGGILATSYYFIDHTA